MKTAVQFFIDKIIAFKRRREQTAKKKIITEDYPTFGMWADDERSVEEIMRELRKPRYTNL